MSWAPLCADEPIDGDPEAVRSYGEGLVTTADRIRSQASSLRRLASTDGWETETADAFREQATDLAEEIEKAEERYRTVGGLTKEWAQALEEARRAAASLRDDAQEQQRILDRTPEAGPEAPGPDAPPGTLPVMTPEGLAQNARRAAAERGIEDLRDALGRLVDSHEERGSEVGQRRRGRGGRRLRPADPAQRRHLGYEPGAVRDCPGRAGHCHQWREGPRGQQPLVREPVTIGLDVEVRADGKWAPVPVWEDADPQPWAETVVDDYVRRRRVRCSAQERMVLVQTWAALAEDVRSRREAEDRWMASALAFVPMGTRSAGDLVPMTVAHVTGVQDGGGPDAVVDGLVLPPEQRIGEPLIESIATATGEALRVRQLLVDPQPEAQDHVGLSLVYVWPSPLPEVVVLLDAWFGFPEEGELVLPSFDALAATLTMRVS